MQPSVSQENDVAAKINVTFLKGLLMLLKRLIYTRLVSFEYKSKSTIVN